MAANTISRRKRRRRSSPPADWSNVSSDVLNLIASKIDSIEDCLSLAAVCTWWRSAVGKISPTSSSWLMLTSPRNVTVFYSLTRSKLFQIQLPEIQGWDCFGSPFGWLIAYRVRMKFLETKIIIFNPLTRSSIPLPDPTPTLSPGPDYTQISISKAILTANPADDPDSSAAVVIYASPGGLAFTKPGRRRDESPWSRFPRFPNVLIHDFIYFNRKLFVIGSEGRVFVSDLSAAELVEFAAAPTRSSWTWTFCPDPWKYHFVELGGELCMVVVVSSSYDTKHEHFIEIYKIEVETKEWSRVESLGNRCLVLENDGVSMFCVTADKQNNLCPGCIYYLRRGEWYDDSVNSCLYRPATDAKVWLMAEDESILYKNVYWKLYPFARITPSL